MLALCECGEDAAVLFMDIYLREERIPKYGKPRRGLVSLGFDYRDSRLVAGGLDRQDFHDDGSITRMQRNDLLAWLDLEFTSLQDARIDKITEIAMILTDA